MFLGFLQLKHHGIGGILAPDDATIHSVMNGLNHLGRFGLLRYRRIVLLWRRLKNNHRDYQICRKTEKNDGADLIRNVEHLGCDDPLEHRGQLALENIHAKRSTHNADKEHVTFENRHVQFSGNQCDDRNPIYPDGWIDEID
jgi:hypothetical protein